VTLSLASPRSPFVLSSPAFSDDFLWDAGKRSKLSLLTMVGVYVSQSDFFERLNKKCSDLRLIQPMGKDKTRMIV